MRPLPLIVILLAIGIDSPAWGQTDTRPPTSTPIPIPMPKIRFVDPEDSERGQPSPDVTEAPPEADFIVIPLRAHILGAPDLPDVACHLGDDDIRRIIVKANSIWHKAGIHWALDPIVHEAAANQIPYQAMLAKARKDDRLELLKLLAPEESRAIDGIDVYYVHAFEANGIYLGDRIAFVQETAQLRPVPGGIDEPLPRVTSHELGYALGLRHREDRTNLLASGTTGTRLNQAEVDRVRRWATQFPGATTVPDLLRRLDEAKDQAEAERIKAILKAITPEPTPKKSPDTP